ncbi:putative VAMP-like protein [Dorcoceras hygrometricum]|uniref:Putative VAMP-like protein n=1 Tax=Dorcoceras hygrometricum TaxID=472368 RepID=A0A2Z7BRV7_9LAMI|nr:putative VAMP-like protein [Dorcoceras hygrometricum]
MAAVRGSISYCCISKGVQVLFKYNNCGDHEIESLAAICVEKAPPYHKWYFQTMNQRTFGFLMDDVYVYFAIASESVGNSGVLRFLNKLRDEFRRLAKRGGGSFSRSLTNSNSLRLQEQLLPVVSHMVHFISESVTQRPAETGPSPICDIANGHEHIEGGASSKAPLLGKSNKQEKKKKKMTKDHVISVRGDTEIEDHRRSIERVVNVEPVGLDSIRQGGSRDLASPLRKDLNIARIRPSSQNLHKKWCRQVRIVLAIDAAICGVLFVIWLFICHGTKCMR